MERGAQRCDSGRKLAIEFYVAVKEASKAFIIEKRLKELLQHPFALLWGEKHVELTHKHVKSRSQVGSHRLNPFAVRPNSG
jgi:hypothetical protein